MPKIAYEEHRFGPARELMIAQAEQICDEYAEQGFDLTLRQLYYQFVARGMIPNKDSEYNRLGDLVNTARLAGRLDWHHIVDRTRNLRGLAHWDQPRDILSAVAAQYRTDRWAAQPVRPEVWIEKDALSGVIAGPCDRADVPYFSCRGYVSQSEMWSAARRHIRYEYADQRAVVIHLGDHDPSGIDMTRDIADRLHLFGAETEVIRIALTMDQVRQYDPPPNPAKITDSRSPDYIDTYGDESWELDALEPAVLAALVTDEIARHRDDRLWDQATSDMDAERALLAKAANRWPQVVQYLGSIQ